MIRHFETRAKAKAHIKEKDPQGFYRLKIVKRKRKSKKPYIVGTDIALLHRPDSAY
jgi:hypothetical protein